MKKSRSKIADKMPSGRYVRDLSLTNLRTFRSNSKISFCTSDGKIAQWTIILGENGIGKTTLLQYLAGMTMIPDEAIKNPSQGNKEKSPPPIRPLIAAQNFLGWNLSNMPHPLTPNSKLSVSLGLTDPFSEFPNEPLKKNSKNKFDFSLTYNPGQGGAVQLTASYNLPANKEYLNDLRIFAYGATRHVAGAASPYLSSDAFIDEISNSPVATIFKDDLPLISPEQWLLGLDHVSRSDGAGSSESRRAFDSACRCLVGSLPNVTSIRVKPLEGLSRRPSMALMCVTPFGEIPFSSLSAGYRTMAAWLTDFVKRMHEAFPNLDQPDNGPAVVLIDEFDLHMHPKWQREAMTALSREFPNTQFIVTAHSPIVVQATTSSSKLIVLRRKLTKSGFEETEVIDNPDFASGWRLDQILESVYGMTPRMPEYSSLVARRTELLRKNDLTPTEAFELQDIESGVMNDVLSKESAANEWLFSKLQAVLVNAEAPKKRSK